MIFDVATESADYTNFLVEGVAPSPYSVTLEGALMHVYELEETYNTMMKSIGLSELKYYQATGEDLLICEAGAFSGMLEKVRHWLQLAKEKIIALYNKFVTFMQERVADNKRFVKMHRKTLTSIGSFTVPENSGLYDYSGVDAMIENFNRAKVVKAASNAIGDLTNVNSKSEYRGSVLNDEDVESAIGELRAALAGVDGAIDEKTMLEKITEACKGNKLSGKVDLTKYIEVMSDLGKSIKSAKQARDWTIKFIDQQIKDLKKLPNYAKGSKDEAADKDKQADNVKAVGCAIKVLKGCDTSIVAAYGAAIAALRARAATARKVCTAAIKQAKSKKTSKDETSKGEAYDDERDLQAASAFATTEESARYSTNSIDDIFNAVSIY